MDERGRSWSVRRREDFTQDFEKMAEAWNTAEAKRLRDLKIDPVRTSPDKLARLITHFRTPGASLFAVTEGGDDLHVSKGLARKVRDLALGKQLEWVLARSRDNAPDSGRRGLGDTTHQRELRQLGRIWLEEIDSANPARQLIEHLGIFQGCLYSGGGLLEICEYMEIAPPPEPFWGRATAAQPELEPTGAETDPRFPQLLEHLRDDPAETIYKETRSLEKEIVNLVGYELGALTATVPAFLLWSLDAEDRRKARQDAIFREDLVGFLRKALAVLACDVLMLLCEDLDPGHPLQRYRVAIQVYRSDSVHKLQIWQSAHGQLRSLLALASTATSSSKPAPDVQVLRSLTVSGWKAARQLAHEDSAECTVSIPEGASSDLRFFTEAWLQACRRLRTDALRVAELWPAWLSSRRTLQKRLVVVLKEYPLAGTCAECQQAADEP